jgi:L-ribulose-5-phosphate 3-epimerase UlaE
MNKTLSIGLAGFSFTIEEHAYKALSDYLNALRSSLDASEADEVMHDIEIRMEIFRDSLGKREVINDTDVEK